MIPAHPDIYEEGNLEDGEVIPLLLSEEDMPELMMHLTDLYSKPKVAVVREYACNARDAHLEAGYLGPIEVFKPTALAPSLVIRDHGLGMSLDFVRNVFTKYGSSTKRHSNLLTGTRGLGCKAGLCYTSQIAVKTIWQDLRGQRWKLVGMVSRKEDNTAGFRVVYHEKTDEPTGTEISVPIRSAGDFHQEVDDFFQYWKDGEVLVDGDPPVPFKGERLGENILVQAADRHAGFDDSDLVIMGNVPYRLSPEHKLWKPSEHHGWEFGRATKTICYIKMGSVDFTPNREDLIYSDLTKETLRKLALEVQGRVRWLVEQEVSQAETPWEAIQICHRWHRTYGLRPTRVSYRGQLIPQTWDNDGLVTARKKRYETRVHYEPDGKEAISTAYFMEMIHHAEEFNRMREYKGPVVVVGAPFRLEGRSKFEIQYWTVSQAAKMKLRLYLEQNNIGQLIVLPSTKPYWWTGLKTIPWAEVQATKTLKKSSETQELEGYGFYDCHGQKRLVKDLPPTGVLYAPPDQLSNLYFALDRLRKGRQTDYVLLGVEPRRVPKFLREYPGALPFSLMFQTELDRLAREVLKFPSAYREMMSAWDVELLRGLDKAGKVDDPEIRRLIRYSRSKRDDLAVQAVKAFRLTVQYAGSYMSYDHEPWKWSKNSPVRQVMDFQSKSVRHQLHDKYPLISRDFDPSDEKIPHVLAYLNWHYNQQQGEAANPA